MVLSRFARCCALQLLVVLAPNARAELPTDADVKRIRAKFDEARTALASARARLKPAEHDELSIKLAEAEKALDRYIRLSEQGSARRTAAPPLYAAGGILIADDVSEWGLLTTSCCPSSDSA